MDGLAWRSGPRPVLLHPGLPDPGGGSCTSPTASTRSSRARNGLNVIGRAVEAAQAERKAARDLAEGGDGEYCLSEAGTVCPLLRDGKCMIFEHRPLQCRAFGMDREDARGAVGDADHPGPGQDFRRDVARLQPAPWPEWTCRASRCRMWFPASSWKRSSAT